MPSFRFINYFDFFFEKLFFSISYINHVKTKQKQYFIVIFAKPFFYYFREKNNNKKFHAEAPKTLCNNITNVFWANKSLIYFLRDTLENVLGDGQEIFCFFFSRKNSNIFWVCSFLASLIFSQNFGQLQCCLILNS